MPVLELPRKIAVTKVKPKQASILTDPSRFAVVVCGRRFGKTTTLIIKQFGHACKTPGLHGYFAPTYKQAKLIAWKILKAVVPPHYRSGKPNESELYIPLKNGSVMRLFGMDNAENLYGVKLHSGILDEYDQMDPQLVKDVIRPAVSDTLGPLYYCGTPDASRGHLKKLYHETRAAKKEGKREDWSAFHFKSIEGGYIPPEEIEAAKEELDERTYRQQYEATFETAEGKVYYAFDFDRHVVSSAIYNPLLPVRMFWDFNVDPFCVAFGHMVPRVRGYGRARETYHDIHVFDELVIRNSNTPEMCREALKRDWIRNHKAGLKVYGDATGNSRSTKASLSDYQMIQDIFKNVPGFEMRVKNSNPEVKDRVAAVNSMLRTYSGSDHVFVAPKCKWLIQDLMDVTRKPGTNDIDKTNPDRTHSSDGLGYFIEYEFPVVKGFLK